MRSSTIRPPAATAASRRASTRAPTDTSCASRGAMAWPGRAPASRPSIRAQGVDRIVIGVTASILRPVPVFDPRSVAVSLVLNPDRPREMAVIRYPCVRSSARAHLGHASSRSRSPRRPPGRAHDRQRQPVPPRSREGWSTSASGGTSFTCGPSRKRSGSNSSSAIGPNCRSTTFSSLLPRDPLGDSNAPGHEPTTESPGADHTCSSFDTPSYRAPRPRSARTARHTGRPRPGRT